MESPAAPAVQLQEVSKRFGTVRAVNRVSLAVRPGEFFSLLGPSGCGKTTVLRLIAGLERPEEGEIYIGGQLVYSAAKGIFVPPGRRNLGMVFQNFALWPHMTVAENVAFPLRVRRVPEAECHRAVEAALSLLHLNGLGGRFPHELSGGQQQRVALARALVARPRLLLMDEPLSNLDANLRAAMRTELKRLHQESGATTLYVTHDHVEALTLSDRLAILRDGLVLQVGSPQEVYESPASLFVAAFVTGAGLNVLQGTVQREPRHGIRADPFFLPGRVPAEAGAPVLLAVRPDAWELVPDGVPLIAEQVQFTGTDLWVIGRIDSRVLHVRLPPWPGLVVGSQLRVRPDARRVRVFDASTEQALAFLPAEHPEVPG
jgi:ABC-type sugar transport system ATPase subunit